MGLLLLRPAYARASTDNPFAPLQAAVESVHSQVRAEAADVQDRGKAHSSQLQGEVSGIIWHTERPVVIVDDQTLTVGSHLESATVTAIQPDAVVLTDDSGQSVTLYRTNGLTASEPLTPKDPNTGHMQVHVDDVACRAVLEALAYQADLNIMFIGEVTALIRLHLQYVTWEEALQAVLQAGGCAVTRKERTLTVLDRDNTLATRTFFLNYAKSEDLKDTISELLSEQGRLGIDERLNTLVVKDTHQYLEGIEEAIEQLDQKAPQVLIEVLIVNVKLTDELKMGVDWTIVGSKTATENITFTQDFDATTQLNPYGSLSFFVIEGDWSFQGLLDFVKSQEDVTVLANPKVLVLSNQTATIESVEEIPYQQLSQTEGGGNIGTTEFRDAGVKLEVTPQITEDGYIVMHILPEQSAQVGTYTINGTDTPIIETRKTETSLRVKDGQTVIIGGLRKKEPSRKVSRVPLLGDIPLLGRLFQKVHVKDVDSELGVFITPHIYREEAPAGIDLDLAGTDDDITTLWDKDTIKKTP
jgi:type IV pilus assembly protein PilQ